MYAVAVNKTKPGFPGKEVVSYKVTHISLPPDVHIASISPPCLLYFLSATCALWSVPRGCQCYTALSQDQRQTG